MTKKEVEYFIEEMKSIGDHWEAKDVERVYGDHSLKDALEKRKAELGTFFDIIEKVINS